MTLYISLTRSFISSQEVIVATILDLSKFSLYSMFARQYKSYVL